jgi:hypothetical protein
MFQFNIALLVSFVAVVTSSPAPANLEQRAANCNVVTGALAILKPLGAPATSFCSSYLHIPATSTLTTTSAPPPRYDTSLLLLLLLRRLL